MLPCILVTIESYMLPTPKKVLRYQSTITEIFTALEGLLINWNIGAVARNVRRPLH